MFGNDEREEEENNYKSPFEKKLNTNQQKRTSRISDYEPPQEKPSLKQVNQYDYKSSKNLETKWGS